VTGNKWVLGESPFVIKHREVGMTYSAMSELDFNFFGSELARVVAERF
jgi:hypothetical protein